MHPHYLEFSLRPGWRLALFLAFASLLTLAGCGEAIRIALVTGLEHANQVSAVERALRLDPGNPALHCRAAQLYGASLEPAALTQALAEARRATALDANQFDYWMTLASACEAVRENAGAEQALEHALRLAPRAPQVCWAASNHYLRADRPDRALACFHRLLELSPGYAEPTLALTLRVYGNANLIFEEVVARGSDPQLALAFADFMSEHNQFDAAHRAWIEVAAGSAPFPFAAASPYLERLLAEGRYREAQDVWTNLVARGVVAAPAPSEPGNLVFNGGFEQPPLDAGFDWRFEPSTYAAVDFADASPYAGARCLRVDFPVSQNDDFEPVYQVLPVLPNQTYVLSAYVRSRDITSDSGPRLRVTDPACSDCLAVETKAALGSTPWHQVTARFTTGPQAQVVRLSLWRPHSRVFPMEISGTFWLDAVSVTAERVVGAPLVGALVRRDPGARSASRSLAANSPPQTRRGGAPSAGVVLNVR
jgi:tetratricopeptide (TPR) repeat protein